MEPLTRIVATLGNLLTDLASLLWQVFELGAHWALLIVWIAWWLGAVNWKKTWHFLGKGAWVPVLLLMVVSALVWSRIAPADCPCGLSNFWWQLGYVSMLAGIALICGWLQGVFGWTPEEINLDPPAHAHGSHGHGHHGHGH